MIEYEKVDLDFLNSAPIKIVLTATFDISPATLFSCFEDPNSWGWATIEAVTWETPPPFGTGTTRTIELSGQRKVQEYFLLWEQDRRMAFRFERGDMREVSAFVEDYTVEEIGEGQCRLTWTIVMKLRGFAKLLSPLIGLVMKRTFSKMRDDLVTYVGDNYSEKEPEDLVATFQNADTGVLTPEEAESMRLWAEQERQSTTEDMTASQNAATNVLTPEEMDAIHRAAEKK
ncbi:MAG: SRPBCC family protein [Gammaproteobacteria bacterium]|nr:SRPBCC family protein [Gammaproteobacteria bacterium]